MKAALTLAISVVALATPASAQRTGASFDIGGLSMRYADTLDANAVAVTPAFWNETAQSSFNLSGTVSQLNVGGWSAQGGASASFFTPKVGLLLGEFGGTGGGSARKDGSRTAQILGSARAHLTTGDKGLWIGGGVGGTWDGATWQSLRQAEAAAWTRVDALTAFASVTPIAVGDSIRYADTQLSGGLNLPHVEVNVTGGFRSGSRVPVIGGSAKSWGSATITGWIASKIALVASAGTYPVDLTQGYPGGRFASFSIRLGTRHFAPQSTSVPSENDFSLHSGTLEVFGMSGFETRTSGPGVRELRVLAPRAQTVEITGDFADWQPVQLSNMGGGWWSVSVPIAKGIHEMNVRVDSGAWAVPPGIPTKSDEFGGTVGVLIVQ